MPTMMATRLTKGGQTTIPKEIRSALGIEDSSRVYWTLDDGRAMLTAEPPIPNEVHNEDEFWKGIELAMEDVAAGRVHEASELSARLRKRIDHA